jgi:ankyrin repeat protein
MQQEDNTEMFSKATELDSKSLHSAITSGALDVNTKNKMGASLLHVFTSDNKIDCVKVLLDLNADITACDYTQWNALHIATCDGNMEIMEMLLAHKQADAVINAKTNTGSTPLHYAAREGITLAVLILLEHGADVFIEDEDSRTAFECAVDNRRKECVKVLRLRMY